MSGLDIYSMAVVAFCVAGIIWSYTRPVHSGLQPGDVLCNTKDEED